MTLEEVVHEGRVCGIPFYDIYDMTWGEVQEFVACVQERHNREYKNLSIIAFHEASLIAEFCFGKNKKPIKVYDRFPFWSKKERGDIESNQIKNKIFKGKMPSKKKGGS